MSKTIISIGAPSLPGECAHTQAKEQFADIEFPCEFTFENKMPRSVSIPQGRGLSLMPFGYDGNIKAIKVSKRDELLRIITDIQAIAELNQYKSAVMLSFGEDDSESIDDSEDDQAISDSDNQAKGDDSEQPESTPAPTPESTPAPSQDTLSNDKPDQKATTAKSNNGNKAGNKSGGANKNQQTDDSVNASSSDTTGE